jgi:hypothetical protein
MGQTQLYTQLLLAASFSRHKSVVAEDLLFPSSKKAKNIGYYNLLVPKNAHFY